MAAQYRVEFSDGRFEYVYSADSRSFKPRDVRTAYVKARKKGEAKRAKAYGGKLPREVRAVHVMCVG